ncbi:PD-(D/E)XK nuclease family protein [Rhodococcus sp. PAMC28707]|uniref:PD-(D/E)XK nuclease family protein n=1 Tax=unclassified Rhodococcus (in: high G+C Gram-positive bacteria) TaxID=192944 RepID=UPI00109DF9FA|nr:MULTISPECIES: PD-(D/E)XK nuclease family protein [unclassified Rhodococcus (in: high G+C Gram-positive bacteria)]QCB51975.1 PD-(D/E)XK nuclease family protein [Rhodococcus sp. PAMC28705]QCB59855.1 PD-(D/E)XK nuclease family protein [Rhodococcus sp. PAMC28707]
MSRDLYLRLSGAVSRAKAEAPLAQVTIIVPTRGAIRDVIQHLARHGGVANVRVLTVDLAVAKLAAPALSPRLALPFPLLDASVQKVLIDDPGVFAGVSDQPITAEALAAASRTLGSVANPEAPDATPLVRDMLRVHAASAGAHSSTHYLSHEAYAAAAQRISELGAVIVFLPNAADVGAAEFLRTLSEYGEVIQPTDEPLGTMVLHASDADDEIRSVARLVRKHIAGGTPGHRIGVYYANADPYLRLIHEHFGGIRIEFAGEQCHTLKHRPVARSLKRLLSIDTDTLPRRELLSILSERAVRWLDDAGTPLSLRRAERLTRSSIKIVGGLDWERLAAIEPDHHYAEVAGSLYALVTALRVDLTAIAESDSWFAASDNLIALLERYFTATSTRADDPSSADINALTTICREIGVMDGIAPPPTASGIVNAISVRIDALPEAVGTTSSAVTVGPLSAGAGRDFDVCVVVGAAEGILPATRREDPLLPSELVGRTLADEIQHQKAQFLATLASGQQHRIVSFPRGSMRGGAEKVPSRWLMPTLDALSGSKIGVVDWQKQTADVEAIVTVESFDVSTQTVDRRIGDSAASETEWRLRALAEVSACDRRGALEDPIVAAGMELRSDRLHGEFTRFNGNISHIENAVKFFDAPVSTSRLEEWVDSPYRFFIKTILGVDTLDDPDDAAQLDPLTRGDLIHLSLERYVQATIDGLDATLDRLIEISEEVLADARVDAPGWLPQLWEKDSSIIRRELVEWFELDRADRADGWTPVHVERDFGVEPDVVLLDVMGEQVAFAGKIDRIDRHTDGRIRVTDYKSGQATSYKKLSESEPTDGGTKFQLPVYGLLALTMGNNVTTRYWFVNHKANYETIGYQLTDAAVDVLKADIFRVHRMIRAGYFPPRPPASHWANPLVDLLGKSGLERAWSSLRDVPELADYRAKYGD